jgi:hypothetical protein
MRDWEDNNIALQRDCSSVNGNVELKTMTKYDACENIMHTMLYDNNSLNKNAKIIFTRPRNIYIQSYIIFTSKKS